MIRREVVDTAPVPGGGGELRLVRRGRDYWVMLDRIELMGTRMSGSEEALATLTAQRLRGRAAAQVLIGGYGMGFTLRAALGAFGAGTIFTVAELVPQIIDWARGPLADLTDGCLDDPRVQVVLGDVGKQILASPGRYDAILLDVDNGPDALSRADNHWLYVPAGLAKARAALRPGGVLAVWSAGPDLDFVRRLRQAGFAVEEVAVRARANGKGPRHIIWFALV